MDGEKESVPLNMRKCGQNEIQELIVTVNQAPTIPNQVGGYFRSCAYDAWSKVLENVYVQHVPLQPIQYQIFQDTLRYPEPIILACMQLILCRMFPVLLEQKGIRQIHTSTKCLLLHWCRSCISVYT